MRHEGLSRYMISEMEPLVFVCTCRCNSDGKRGTAEGRERRGKGMAIISKSQPGQHHPAWPAVSEVGERVNTPSVST